RREHRWVRGDWQILPWLFPTVPSPRGRARNPLTALARWKILDNLRRSLVPPCVIALVALGWIVLPGAPWVWTSLAALVVAMPLVLRLASSIIGTLGGGRLLHQLRELRGDLPNTAAQSLLSLLLLADQARL